MQAVGWTRAPLERRRDLDYSVADALRELCKLDALQDDVLAVSVRTSAYYGGKRLAPPLHHYRAYHLDRDGHIKRAEIVSAEGDEAALGRLRTTRNGYGIEMWDRARFVGKVAPYEPQSIEEHVAT